MDEFQNYDSVLEFLTTSSGNSTLERNGNLSSPPINCKEKLVIFFDRCSEIKSMDVSTSDGKKLDPFDRLKKLVRIYLQLKNAMSPSFRNDEYYLLTEMTNGKFNSASTKTDVDTVLSQLKKVSVDPKPSDDQQFFQLDDILRRIFDLIPLPPEPLNVEHFPDITVEAPPYIVRIILFVTRSRGDVLLDLDEELRKKLRNPYLYVDILHIHENPSTDNKVTEIFEKLRSLDNFNCNKGYIFETGSDLTNWHNCSAFLLTHPFIRPSFDELLKTNKFSNTTPNADPAESNVGKKITDEKLVDI